jgi:hypothetical protein
MVRAWGFAHHASGNLIGVDPLHVNLRKAILVCPSTSRNGC